MPIWDKIMLKKRVLIESVFNLLKSSCQIEHHRHRSKWNFLSHLLSALSAYCLLPHKPRLDLFRNSLHQLQIVDSRDEIEA
jgi:hypothetical protein